MSELLDTVTDTVVASMQQHYSHDCWVGLKGRRLAMDAKAALHKITHPSDKAIKLDTVAPSRYQLLFPAIGRVFAPIDTSREAVYDEVRRIVDAYGG